MILIAEVKRCLFVNSLMGATIQNRDKRERRDVFYTTCPLKKLLEKFYSRLSVKLVPICS